MATIFQKKKYPPNLYEQTPKHVWEVPVGRRNVGGYERTARIGFGILATAISVSTGLAWFRALTAVLGLTGLTTGISGFCPMSEKLGRDTYHHD